MNLKGEFLKKFWEIFEKRVKEIHLFPKFLNKKVVPLFKKWCLPKSIFEFKFSIFGALRASCIPKSHKPIASAIM